MTLMLTDVSNIHYHRCVFIMLLQADLGVPANSTLVMREDPGFCKLNM